MKKALFILGAAVALLIPVSAYAASVNSDTGIKTWGPFRRETEDLTEQQKEDFEETFDEMMEVRRNSINKMIENGLMTKEQGEEALKDLDDMVEYHEDYGFTSSMGMMNGYTRGRNNEYGSEYRSEYGSGYRYGCGRGRGMMYGSGRGMWNWY